MSKDEALSMLRDTREGRIYIFDGLTTVKAEILDALGDEEVKLW